ncbi:MAG: hypothetical protein ACLQU3_05020 [Limisphaerales bacterium]
MFSTGRYLLTIIGLIWSAATALAAPVGTPLPLEKGMRWAYEGKVEWTVMNSTRVLSTNIHWVMEVVDVIEKGAVRASVVRGLPDELAWYEPNRKPGFSVLLGVTNHVYRIPAASEKDGEKLAKRLTHEPDRLPSCAEEWLVLPLAKGKRWAGDSDREDNNYCWYVQGKKKRNVRVDGYAATHPAAVWTLIYRTNPDHQIVDLVEGLGITRYVFVHHGTVASADVRLVSFRHQ